ncbi:hypothetical protein TcCL_NonESM09493, partial [Trypanosoma cruzi]
AHSSPKGQSNNKGKDIPAHHENCWSTGSAANIQHKNSSVALGLSSYSAHTTSCRHSHHRPRRRCKNWDARSFPREKATLGHQGVATTRFEGELGQRWLLQASPSWTAASPFPKIPALLAEGPSARVTRSPSFPRPLAAH